MPHVVILGGGFAGCSAARELERRRRAIDDLQVTLVDKRNFMLFTPLLPEVVTGAVEPRHATIALRSRLRHTEFQLGEVCAIDDRAQEVHVRHPLTHEQSRIGYDQLILAFGSTPSTMGVSGVERHAHPLRTLADAQRLRSTVLSPLEVAAVTKSLVERETLLRFVIVGGGFTGVEAAGELLAFLHDARRLYPECASEQLSMVLLQGESRLLPHLPERFGKYAARTLRERGVSIEINARVESVDGGGVTLKDGRRFESRTIVWCVGEEPAPFVSKLGVPHDKGAVRVREDLSIEGHPNLWAIGDCAAIPKPGGGSYAQLAQNAVREGPHVARNVIARLRGRATKPFRYHLRGMMASLGDRNALVELPGGRMLRGFPAWVIWRAYYLQRLPSIARKANVAADWVLDGAFGPPLTRPPLVERGETSFEETYAPRK